VSAATKKADELATLKLRISDGHTKIAAAVASASHSVPELLRALSDLAELERQAKRLAAANGKPPKAPVYIQIVRHAIQTAAWPERITIEGRTNSALEVKAVAFMLSNIAEYGTGELSGPKRNAYSIADMAKRCGLSERKMAGYVRWLTAEGYIETITPHGYKVAARRKMAVPDTD
jgi:hypothetical protein